MSIDIENFIVPMTITIYACHIKDTSHTREQQCGGGQQQWHRCEELKYSGKG